MDAHMDFARGSLAALITITFVSCTSPTAAAEPTPDLILTGGKVYAEGGWAGAVAVKDGLIEAVGTVDKVGRLRGPTTRMIDLAGAPVFPGLNDTHAHMAFAAQERAGCKVPPAPWDAIAEAVRRCTETTSPGQWIVTGPVDESVVAAAQPRQALDAAAPGNPVLVYLAGGHTVLANSSALAAGSIEESTPTPPGAVLGRDGSGRLNGVLKEIMSIWTVVPHADPKTVADLTRPMLDMMLAAGVTSMTEANSTPVTIAAYSLLADQHLLKMRVRTCARWEAPMPFAAVTGAPIVVRDRLDTRCVKIFVDGETYSGRTAALIEPYQPADGSTTNERGSLRLSREALQDAVTYFDKAGITVKFHAMGDAAVEAAISAIEAARAANGPNGPRHEVGHSFLVRHSDFARARSANAVLEFSPSAWDPRGGAAFSRELGAERKSRLWPVREALDQGVTAVGGTDYITAQYPYGLWYAIETLVTRLLPSVALAPGETQGEPLAPSQRITLEQAIALFTANPARASHNADAPGIIAPGRRADMIVLDRNPFEIPITQVYEIKTVTAIVGGEIVYQAAKN